MNCQAGRAPKMLLALLTLLTLLTLVALLTLVTLAAPGCAPAPGATTAPKAQTVSTIPLLGGPIYFLDGQALSPDGNWAAIMAANGGQKQELRLYPATGGEGRTLAEVSAVQLEAGTLMLCPLGWSKHDELVFARQGTQPDGPHQGQRGVSLRVTDPQTGDTREAGWVPVPPDKYVNEMYPVAGEAVFIYAGETVYRIPLDGGGPQVVKPDLASFGGPFAPRPSPDGAYLAYENFAEDGTGVWVAAAATGAETCIAPRGQTWSFYPAWSPDGRHVAYYTAAGKTGSEDTFEGYDMVPAEDGPRPAAGAIDVATPDGRQVAHLTLGDYKLAQFTWAEDSQRLAFATCTFVPDPAGDPLAAGLAWDALYLASLDGAPAKVADLAGSAALDVFPLYICEGNDGVYYMTYEESGFALWLGRPGKKPRRLDLPEATGGGFWPTFPVLSYKQGIFLPYDLANARYLVQAFKDQLVVLATGGEGTYFAGLAGRRLAYTVSDPATGATSLVVVEFAP